MAIKAVSRPLESIVEADLPFARIWRFVSTWRIDILRKGAGASLKIVAASWPHRVGGWRDLSQLWTYLV